MDKTDDEIIDIYRGLWRIEETFKVTKSELEARPVYVSRKEHIEAHFLTCIPHPHLLGYLFKHTL